MMPFQIILADDHALFRSLMRNSIEPIPDFQIVGEASDGFKLLDLLKTSKPDLVILDIMMPNLQGIEAAKEIKKTYPGIKILILTMHKSKDHLRSALAAGVDGYLLKEDAYEDLITAIRTIRLGKNYLSSLVSAPLKEILGTARGEVGLDKSLTTREIVILKLLAEGKSSQEIADLLFISVSTVNRHRFNIRDKLNMKTTAELVRYAIDKGYTSPA